MLRLPALALAAAALALTLGAPSSDAASIFLDDMASPLYGSFSFNGADSGSNPDDTSTVGSSNVGSGGNPDAYLQAIHDHSVARDDDGNPLNGDGFTFLQSGFVEQSFTYVPALDGAIQTIGFRIDLLLEDLGTASAFDTIAFAIEDANGGSFAAFTPISPSSGWQTIEVLGLTQADFGGRDFAGALDLRFGFSLLSGGDVTFADESIAIGIDNFEVLVTVPEPGSVLLVGIGAGALALRRRRL